MLSYQGVPLSLSAGYNSITMTTEVEFSFDEAVRTLGVTPEKLTRLVEDGKIVATNDGVRTWFSRRAILDYMAAVSAVPAIERSKRR
jgi:hypothetical protein